MANSFFKRFFKKGVVRAESRGGLPRIIGVDHSKLMRTDGLDASVKHLIDSLPSHSTIGLERAGVELEALPPLTRIYLAAALKGKKVFFKPLADYALQKGHEVYWLERPSSRRMGERGFSVEAERILLPFKELVAAGQISELPPAVHLNIALLGSKYPQSVLGPMFAKWRSGIMAKYLLRKAWRPTDIAVVGAYHAFHLSEMLGAKVDYFNVDLRQPPHPENLALAERYYQAFQARKQKRKK